MVLDLCITICARGGSKRLADKNIKIINGKTLIDISILQALSMVAPQNIIFSSDNKKYISIAEKYGVSIHKRDQKLSSDESDKLDVIKNLSKLTKMKYLIDLDVTAPLRDENDIIGVYSMLKAGRDISYAACKMESINPYFNMVEIKKDKKIGTVKKNLAKRSQDTPNVFLLNSIIGWKTNYLSENNTLFSSKNFGIWEMEEHKMFDIDTLTDYKIVKSLMEEKT